MAAKTDQANTPEPAAEPQWQTVSDEETQQDEQKITLDYIGQSFTGEYLGTRQVPSKDEFGFQTGHTFTQYRFKDESGSPVFLNPLASLREPMSRVRAGSKVRLTYVSDKDTGQPSLMQIIRVEVDASNRKRTRSPITVTSAQDSSEPPF